MHVCAAAVEDVTLSILLSGLLGVLVTGGLPIKKKKNLSKTCVCVPTNLKKKQNRCGTVVGNRTHGKNTAVSFSEGIKNKEKVHRLLTHTAHVSQHHSHGYDRTSFSLEQRRRALTGTQN